MSKRKTISVDDLKATANVVFHDSDNDYMLGRLAIQTFVTHLLQKNHAYDGFQYLSKSMSGQGKTIGIQKNQAGENEYPDPTRIRYY